PGPGARRQLRADGGAVHRSVVGGGEPAPRRAGQRRLDPDLGHAGGPRLDGVGSGAQAALGARQPRPHPGRGAGRGFACVGPARAAQACAGDRRRARCAAQAGGRGGSRPRGGARPRRRRSHAAQRRDRQGGAGGGRAAAVTRTIRAPRGTEISCRGWTQEAALRMLMNNLDPEVAERPEDLVVYGGTGKAARSWAAFDAIVASLKELGDEQTLLVQSGKPVGVFDTHEWAPRVLIANSLLVPEWATWEEFRRLEALGLTMYGQMTAGSWIYIGTQGILQGTYETFAAVAAKRFGGSLAGTI